MTTKVKTAKTEPRDKKSHRKDKAGAAESRAEDADSQDDEAPDTTSQPGRQETVGAVAAEATAGGGDSVAGAAETSETGAAAASKKRKRTHRDDGDREAKIPRADADDHLLHAAAPAAAAPPLQSIPEETSAVTNPVVDGAGVVAGAQMTATAPTGATATSAALTAPAAPPAPPRHRFASFAAKCISETTVARGYKDQRIPGCLEVQLRVIESRETKKDKKTGDETKGPDITRIMGTGVVTRIFMRDADGVCARVVERNATGDIMEAELVLMVEEGVEKKRTYVRADSRDVYRPFLTSFDPVRIMVGAVLDFSVAKGPNFSSVPPVGKELRFNVRHNVVPNGKNGPRDFTNTPGVPMESEQRGIFQMDADLTAMLLNVTAPRTWPPRYDGHQETVRFPLFITGAATPDEEAPVTSLVGKNLLFTENVTLQFRPPTKDEIDGGHGLNRPMELGVRITICTEAELVVINQPISIFQGALALALPGMTPTRFITFITANPSMAALLDLKVFYKGRRDKPAMHFAASEADERRARDNGLKLTMGCAQAEATASFVIVGMRRLLHSTAPQFALGLHPESALVTAALVSPMDAQAAAVSMVPATEKDLRDHRSGTTAVLCVEVARCLAGMKANKPAAEVIAAAEATFRGRRYVRFFVLRQTGEPIDSDTLDILSGLNPKSPEYAKQVKVCIKDYFVVVHIEEQTEADREAGRDADDLAAVIMHEQTVATSVAPTSANAVI